MSESLNICILQTHLPSQEIKSGGEERFTWGFAKNLSKRHRVSVLTKGNENRTVVRGNLTIKYIKCTKIRYIRFFHYFFMLVREALKIKGLDIVQSHISDQCNGLAGIVVSKIRKIPMVARVSGFDPLPRLSWIQKWLLVKIFKNSDVVVSINKDFMEREIRQLWKKSKIIVLPHGIAPGHEAKMKKFPVNGQKKLLYAGRLVWYKNVEMLVKVMGLLSKKMSNPHLTIIGTGPEESELKTLFKKAGLEKNVTFKGEMHHDNLLKYMGKSSLFMFPSKNEPRGLVLIESMAAGLPVIAINRGGPKEIIKDGRNGFLVAANDYEKMAGKAYELLKNKELYEGVSRNNIQDVKIYDWPKVVKKWEDMYTTIPRTPKPSSPNETVKTSIMSLMKTLSE